MVVFAAVSLVFTVVAFPSSALWGGSCWRAICVAVRCCYDRVVSLNKKSSSVSSRGRFVTQTRRLADR